MNFKKGLAIACAAATLTGTVTMSGCFLLPGKKDPTPVTVSASGFTATLTSEYTKLRIDKDGDDILKDNTILFYDSDDIMFSVAQVKRADVAAMHLLDLGDFASYVAYEYYNEATAQMEEVASEDQAVKGYKFEMHYNNSSGYDNVQCDYLFAGTTYFYEVAFVTIENDFEALESKIESIALSCTAEDGLDQNKLIELKEFTVGEMKACFDDTFRQDTDSDGDTYYTNGIINCYATVLEDVKFLSLQGVANYYYTQTENYEAEFELAKTKNQTDYAILAETDANGNYVTAIYIDDKGTGYVYEYSMPKLEYSDPFVDDIFDYMENAGGAIDNYKTTPPTANEKTFENSIDTPEVISFSYSIKLDDTFIDLGMTTANGFTLYSPEYDRIVNIYKSNYANINTAFTNWKNNAPQGSYRETTLNGEISTGLTYEYGKNGIKLYYEFTIFVKVGDLVYIVSLESNLKYFTGNPTDQNSPDGKFVKAVNEIVIS